MALQRLAKFLGPIITEKPQKSTQFKDLKLTDIQCLHIKVFNRPLPLRAVLFELLYYRSLRKIQLCQLCLSMTCVSCSMAPNMFVSQYVDISVILYLLMTTLHKKCERHSPVSTWYIFPVVVFLIKMLLP